MNVFHIVRKDGTFRDCLILIDEASHKYRWVNLTTHHICACQFESIEGAIADLNDREEVDKYKIINV